MVDVIQTAFSAGEISDDLMGRVDLDWYRLALARCRNVIVHPHGGVSNRGGTHFVGAVKNHAKRSRLIEFQFSNIQTYILEFGDQIMRVIKDGQFVLEANKTISGATKANPVSLQITGHGYTTGQDIFVSGVGGMTQINNKFFTVTVTDANNITIGVNGTAYDTYTSGGTAAKVYELATPFTEAQVQEMNFVQSADVMYIAHQEHPPQELIRYDHDDWDIGDMEFIPSMEEPASISATASNVTAPTVAYKYVVTAEDEDGNESLASDVVNVTCHDMTDGSINAQVSLSWPAVTGAVQYNLYRETNGSGVYGWIGRSGNLAFIDKNIQPDNLNTPIITAKNPFNAVGDYPAATSFYEERLVFASTINNPQTIYMSHTGRYNYFSVSKPARDDEAVTFTPISRKVTSINHLVDLNDLILLTNDGEWRVHGGNQGDPITPSSINPKRQTGWGSTSVTPILIGDVILYVQKGGRKVRALGYSLESDGYKGNDLTIRVPHFFESGATIIDMAYAQEPDSVVWCVLSDGQLAAFTYIQEQNVWAWHLHETDGIVENISVITEGGYDVAYIVVKRTIGESDVRYIEKMDTRTFIDIEDAFFVDCGLSYSGSPISAITSGLEHLEGKAVAVLADGNVQNQKMVTNGGITLDRAASKISVGLPYRSYIKTLRVALNTPAGAQNKKKVIEDITVRVKRTRGIKIGADLNDMMEIKPDYFEPDEALPMITGDLEGETYDSGWEASGQIVVAQEYPLPMTVVAIIPKVKIGG